MRVNRLLETNELINDGRHLCSIYVSYQTMLSSELSGSEGLKSVTQRTEVTKKLNQPLQTTKGPQNKVYDKCEYTASQK